MGQAGRDREGEDSAAEENRVQTEDGFEEGENVQKPYVERGEGRVYVQNQVIEFATLNESVIFHVWFSGYTDQMQWRTLMFQIMSLVRNLKVRLRRAQQKIIVIRIETIVIHLSSLGREGKNHLLPRMTTLIRTQGTF